MLHSLRRRAKRGLGLRSVAEGHTGAVTFIQRFDSAIRLDVHCHTEALDGERLQTDGCEDPLQTDQPALADGYAALRRTFREDLAVCERCGAPVRIGAARGQLRRPRRTRAAEHIAPATSAGTVLQGHRRRRQRCVC